MDNILFMFAFLIIWIIAGGIWAFWGPYDWKYPSRNKLITNIMVLPFVVFSLATFKLTALCFEILDWVVYKFYYLTSYTKKYMKRKK